MVRDSTKGIIVMSIMLRNNLAPKIPKAILVGDSNTKHIKTLLIS